MNVVKSLTVALLALSGLALGQENQAKLNLLLELKTGRPAQVELLSANGAGKFTYIRGGSSTQGQLANCNLFMIVTPADLAAALTSYRANDLEKAKPRLAAVKKKYASTLGLPQDPASQAAYYELLCAIRLRDWSAVKSLAASYPRAAANTDRLKLFVQVAGLLGDLASPSTSGAALQQKVEKFMANKKNASTMNIEAYGFLRYALAEAIIAQLPAAEIKSSSLKGENAKKAVQAVDLLCEAVVSQHGANREFCINALTRAAKLLWSTEQAHEYLVEIGLNAKMTAATWKSAPTNFREAVTLAYMASIYSEEPLSDKDINKMLEFYFGPAKQGSK